MPRYLFTIVALFVFLIAYTYEEYRVLAQNVSPETLLKEYRDQHTLSTGTSPDGSIHISEVIDPPHVSHNMQFANHERTLRAFFAPNKGGVETIYIEQARPNKFFAIVGVFEVLPETVSLFWSQPMTLVFYATTVDGVFVRNEINLHTLIVKSTPLKDMPKTHSDESGILTSD